MDDGSRISEGLQVPLSSVSFSLKRIGLGRRRLQTPEPPNQYERPHPGELVHIDVKKLTPHLRPLSPCTRPASQQVGLVPAVDRGHAGSRLADDLEGAHHVVLLVLEDVAVPDVLRVGDAGRELDRALVG